MKNKELRIIRRIQAEAWGKFGSKLFIERERAGTMKKVINLAITKEAHRFTPEQLDKLKNIKESGMLDGKERVEDPKVAKRYEKYVEKRIAEEIKRGTLTDPNEAHKKSQKYGRKNKRNHA